MEKQKILEILLDWNYWNKELPKTYFRERNEKYIDKLSKAKENIIIKGIRRCGKSTILINHIKNKLSTKEITKEQILFINFEDSRFQGELNTDLIEKIYQIYLEEINSDIKPIIILDEIQVIKKWEKWVRKMYDLNKADIFITGSSSKLLSKEFGTALGGRSLEIELYPLSFEEFLVFRDIKKPKTNLEIISNKIKYKKLFKEYLKVGGFPKIVQQKDKLFEKQEIQNYFETIILKDIVARYNLKNYENVKKVAKFIISTITSQHSINSIRKATNISYELVEKYIEYLKDTYLFFSIPKFSTSLKKQFKEELKFYTIDNSFLNHISFSIIETKGVELENLVAIELKRRGVDLYYHKQKKECDFIILKNKKISAIQVTFDMSNEETKKREIEGLIDACKSYKLKEGLILTEDDEYELEQEGIKIQVKPIWKWLLIYD